MPDNRDYSIIPDADAVSLDFSKRHAILLCDVLSDAMAAAVLRQKSLHEKGDIAGMASNEVRIADLEEIHAEVYFCCGFDNDETADKGS